MNGFTPEIEQEVLGALLTGAPFPLVKMIATRDHFIHAAHKRVYDACEVAHDRTGTCKNAFQYVDKQALTGELINDGVSAGQYLAHLAANVTFGARSITESTKKVVEQWARLAVAEELSVLSESALDPAANVKSIVSRAGESLDDIMSDVRRGTNRKTRHKIFDATQDALKSAQEARERGSGITGITWGLSDVNRTTGGLQPRDLTLMAARPSMGKTTVAMSCALNMVRAGNPVAMISLEMDAEKVATRMACDHAFSRGAKIAYADVIRGAASQEDLDKLSSTIQDFSKYQLYIEDQPSLTMADIRVKLEANLEQSQKDGNPLSALIVDHIGLIKPASRYSGNRVQEMAEISGGLKAIAREYDIAVLALSQLSRMVEQRNDKRPMLSDLRDSGALEQDADTVIFLYREAYYLDRDKDSYKDEEERLNRLVECQNKLEFIIAKQRNGAIRTIDLYADMALSAIRNAA